MTWQGTGTSISGGVSEDATQLCTLAQVKRALGVSDSDTDDDDALVQIIQQVSAQMEGLGGANRRMTEHTLSYAYFDVPHAGCDILYAPAWPIVSCGAVVEAAGVFMVVGAVSLHPSITVARCLEAQGLFTRGLPLMDRLLRNCKRRDAAVKLF